MCYREQSEAESTPRTNRRVGMASMMRRTCSRRASVLRWGRLNVAIEVGDAVIMKNDLSLAYTYRLAKMDRIIWPNIFFSMFIVALLVRVESIWKNEYWAGGICP